MAESGAAYSEGIGTGYAQVFPGSQFDGPTFLNNLRIEQENKKKAAAAEKIERAKENRKALREISFDTGTGRWGEDIVRKMADDALNNITNITIQGGTADSPEVLRAIQETKNQLATARQKKDYLDKQDAAYKAIVTDPENFGKVDPKAYMRWRDKMKELEKMGDLDAMIEYSDNNNPFKPKVDTETILSFMKIPVQLDQQGRRITKGVNPETALDIVSTNIDEWQESPQMQEMVQAYYDTYGPEGTGEFSDLESMKQFLAGEAQVRGLKEEKTLPSPQGGGGMNISVGNYSVPDGVTPAGKTADMGSQNTWGEGELAEVSIKLKGKDLAPMEVVDRNGNLVYFKPSQYYKAPKVNKSGLSPGEWGVKGQVYGRPGEERLKEGETTEQAFSRIMRTNPGAEIVPKGDGVSFSVYKPLKSEVISYDKNDIRFQSALEGFDLYDYEKNWNASNAGKKKGTQGNKSVTDVSNIFGGQ